MIKSIQSSEGKTISKFDQSINKYSGEMKYLRQSGHFHFDEDPFAKNAQKMVKVFHQVILLEKFLETKPQIKLNE